MFLLGVLIGDPKSISLDVFLVNSSDSPDKNSLLHGEAKCTCKSQRIVLIRTGQSSIINNARPIVLFFLFQVPCNLSSKFVLHILISSLSFSLILLVHCFHVNDMYLLWLYLLYTLERFLNLSSISNLGKVQTEA